MLNKLKKVIIFDAFPKVEAGYQNSSSQGGLVTVIVSILLWILIISEFIEYCSVNHKYEFLVDNNINHKIQLNVDITINTPCQFLLINVVDVAGEVLHMTNELKVIPTVFEVGSAHHIGEENPSKIDIKRLVRDALKQGDIFSDNEFLGNDLSACRIFGNLEVNKVAGKLHISDIVSMGGLSDPNAKVSDSLNFSHRIDEFSFGTHYPLLVNPLDNSIEISQENHEAFQYFLSIVPTTYIDNNNRILYTNQYSVTDYNKIIDINKGLISVPGIFFKYDIEPISVRITENSKIGFIKFLVRLCGLVGGVWVTAAFSYKIINHFLFLFVQINNNNNNGIINLSNNKVIQLEKIN